jgi:hypothetical protein
MAALAHQKAPSDSATARSIAAAQNGSVLAMLQSLEYATDTLAGCIGEGAGWTLVTLIEAWKCACRYRLLQLVRIGGERTQDFGFRRAAPSDVHGSV